jgi:hypothetical protein
MYIEQLATPHPHQANEAHPARPFLDAVGIEDMAQTIQDARALGDQAYAQAVHEVAPVLCDAVSNSLTFRSIEKERPAGTTVFDTLKNEQVTNCYGFTAVTSEALSLAGIEHWIAFAGNHAFTAVPLKPGGKKRELYMADGYCPELNGNFAAALMRHTVPEMATQMNHPAQPRGRALLDVQRFANLRGYHTVTEFMQDNRLFFSFKAPSPYRQDERALVETEKHPRVVMSTFHPAAGTLALQQAARFVQAAKEGKAAVAADALDSIPGMYPQIDAHAPHTEIREVVTALCEQRSFARARRAARNYCQSFSVSQDPRLAELEGDLWLIVASYKPDTRIAGRAQALYRSAAERARYAWARTALNKKLGTIGLTTPHGEQSWNLTS